MLNNDLKHSEGDTENNILNLKSDIEDMIEEEKIYNGMLSYITHSTNESPLTDYKNEIEEKCTLMESEEF